MANPLTRAISLALHGAALSTVAFAAPVLAQSDADADAEKLETITVVGSRIKRTDIETSQPVFVLDREDLAKTGMTSVGDILQDLVAGGGAALNTTFNNGGNGATQIDLRNLGPNRTLVLVNGRRWVTDNGGVVDLNTIPVAAIERVEVLKDGASSIYGSDAIAGVINITTRDTFDGAEASAYLGENEEGDGRTEMYEFTIGSSTDRASVLLNASYTKQEPIFAGDRDISAVPLFGFPGNNVTAGASSTTPFGRFGFGSSGATLPNGAPGTLTLIPGRPGTAATDFKPFSTAVDGFNFAPDNYLLTPQERTSVFAQARYQLTDTIAFKATMLYNERRSEQLLAAIPFTLGASPGATALQRAVTISQNSIYNPFGVDVTRAQFRNTTQLRSFNQDVDTFYFSGAFDGTFDVFDRSFSWDAGYVYTDSERRDVTFGQFDVNRLRTGLGPSFIDAGGVARCGTEAAVIAGCVPLNLFGGPDGFTREMADYATVTLTDTRYNKLYNYTANLTGDLFELPAGPLGFAAGYEYRRVFGLDQPDAITASGATTGNARAPTSGSFSLDEVYVEFNVPVLKDVAFAEVLEFSVAARASDYSNFGDTLNPKFGFRWKPFSDLLVRGNYSEGFRAPSVSELFLGATDGFPAVSDPCSETSNPTGTVADRCFNGIGDVSGVPEGYQQGNSQIRATGGGNVNLQPETARTKTLGMVYSASWLEGLDLYLDWYNIQIENVIGLPAAQFVVDDCYLFGNLRSCELIERDQSGEIINLLGFVQNNPGVEGLEVEGFDFTADYRFDTRYGKFHIVWDNAYVSYLGDLGQPEAGDILSNGSASLGNTVGILTGGSLVPQWRLRSNITTSWQYGDFGATLGMRYRSALDEGCSDAVDTADALGRPELRTLCAEPDAIDPQFGGPTNKLDDIYYFDLQATWDTPWNGRITGGIRNLTDENPPVSYSTFANSFDPQYDVPGRFWYVSYTQRF
jgi:iron complex outermembrane receptor protein